jgi:hypothetical protein
MEKENANLFIGFNLEKEISERDERDWQFGTSGDTEVKVPNGDWTPFLPSNEKQRQGFESMCCTNFSSTTSVEILFTWMLVNNKISAGNLQWLKDKGYFDVNGKINFSDRFDAIISGTSPITGNSLKAPAEGKRKNGLIPERMLPWTDDHEAYFDKTSITQEMYALGQEFLKRFPINYELDYDQVNGFQYAPPAGACHAWDNEVDGVYIRSNGSINHAICRIKPPVNQKLMDSYPPFVKTMADDYIFMSYGIRYIVRENIIDEPTTNQKKNIPLNTVKFQTDPRVFIQNPLNDNRMAQIYDKDGTSEADWQIMKDENFITKEPQIILDAYYPQYTIVPFKMNGDLISEPSTNPFSSLIAWLVGLFGKKKGKK